MKTKYTLKKQYQPQEKQTSNGNNNSNMNTHNKTKASLTTIPFDSQTSHIKCYLG